MSAAFAGAMLVVMSGRGRIFAGALLGAAVLAKGLVPLALFLPVLWFWRKRVADVLVLLAVAGVIAATVVRSGNATERRTVSRRLFLEASFCALLHRRASA